MDGWQCPPSAPCCAAHPQATPAHGARSSSCRYMTGRWSGGLMLAFFLGQVPLMAVERQLAAALRCLAPAHWLCSLCHSSSSHLFLFIHKSVRHRQEAVVIDVSRPSPLPQASQVASARPAPCGGHAGHAAAGGPLDLLGGLPPRRRHRGVHPVADGRGDGCKGGLRANQLPGAITLCPRREILVCLQCARAECGNGFLICVHGEQQDRGLGMGGAARCQLSAWTATGAARAPPDLPATGRPRLAEPLPPAVSS